MIYIYVTYTHIYKYTVYMHIYTYICIYIDRYMKNLLNNYRTGDIYLRI